MHRITAGLFPIQPANLVLPTRGRILSAAPEFQARIDGLPNVDESCPTESARMEAFGRLACGVAHDFNNLLTGIMVYCDLLIAGLEDNCPLRCHAEEIRGAGLDGVALIQRLLTQARPQLVEASLSGNQVITGSKNFMTRLLGGEIELITALADDLGYVRMDPAQIRRILFNLVLNARDAMPQGGRVTVETRNSTNWLPNSEDLRPHRAPCIEFTVTDTGFGMDAETRSHLFDRSSPPRIPVMAMAWVWSQSTASLSNTAASCRWKAMRAREPV